MSNNPNYTKEAQDQNSIKQGWLSNEFGLQPKNILEKVLKNFIKTWSYMFGWDDSNNIWRALKVDVFGNLRTVNGTQVTNPPALSSVELTTTDVSVLSRNPDRSSFAIYNLTNGASKLHAAITLTYPNPQTSQTLSIPPGFVYIDDTWGGTLTLTPPGVSNDNFVTLAEFD